MNRIEKIAMLNLILTATGFLIICFRALGGDRTLRIFTSGLVLVICGALVVSYAIRWRIRKRGGTHFDERDEQIRKRATTTGLGVLSLVVVAESLFIFVIRPLGTISIGALLTIVVVGGLSCFLAESISVLAQYGRGGKGEKS